MSCNQLVSDPSTHVKRERKEHMMSRLQQHQQPQSGLALCLRVILDSVGKLVGPSNDTHTVHWCPKGKAVGGPTPPPQDDSRKTTTRQRRALSRTCFKKQVQSYTCNHTWWKSSATITWQMSRSGKVSNHQEDRTEKRNPKHVKIPQNQYTDKVVDMSVVGKGDPISGFGLDLRYCERACWRFVYDT